MPAGPIIVLSIDGLRASALGAYGNTWRPTSALDRFACESLLVEHAYADLEDISELMTRYPPGLYDNRLESQLVSDDPAILSQLGNFCFTSSSKIAHAEVAEPAKSIGETRLAAMFGMFADAVAGLQSTGESSPLLWLHSQGLAGPWDAPTALIEELVEEDDPTPAVSVEPATGRVDRRDDPDTVFAAACRYAAQVSVLDACLEGWLDFVEELFADQPPTIVLLGTRGYALGEHGAIGLDEPGPYNESRHVPLLIRSAGATAPGRRYAEGLVGLSQLLPQLLGRLDAITDGELEVEHCFYPPEEKLALPGRSAEALLTPDWRLIRPKDRSLPAELYVAPDDRWQANDIASLERGIVVELEAELDRLRAS